MTEEHKMWFLLTLAAIAAVYLFRKLKSSDDGIRGLLPGAGARKAAKNTERNGIQNDFLFFIQKLFKLVGKQKWYMLLPGTLEMDGSKTNLNGILVTRCGIIGFKTFGFGGRISKNNGIWTQVLNGKKTNILSIEDERQRQQGLLRSILEKNGMGDIPVEVIAIFTTPNVVLEHINSNHYLTSEDALLYLKSEKFQPDTGIAPKEIGKKLEAFKYNPS